MEIRLQKYLADCGIASRRKAEELILQGKVEVNNKIVKELGTKIDNDKDEVKYLGNIIKPENNEKVYILLNKPIGYVTTLEDQFDRPTVLDLVKINKRIVPVGRLDMYTSGAIILTNDGDFVYKVTHPKHEINKTYTVTIIGKITKDDIKKLQTGVKIDDVKKLQNGTEINDEYVTKPAKVKILKIDEEKNQARLAITIHEGKNRQVRKMITSIGKKVIALHRAKIGDIEVKDLELGKWRYLKKSEINRLLEKI